MSKQATIRAVYSSQALAEPDERLLNAVVKGNENAVKTQLQSKITQREGLNRSLIHAAASGNDVICELLIDAGADVNSREDKQEHVTRHRNPAALTSEGLQRQQWMERHSALCGTSLHRAAENGHVTTVALLLARGSSANAVDGRGYTPLMLACMRRGYASVVSKLLDASGCDVRMKDHSNGRTALHHAVYAGDAIITQMLLQRGGESDPLDDQLDTPLLLAVRPYGGDRPGWPPRNATSCIDMLLSRGAFADVCNSCGENALQLAVHFRDAAAVRCLVRHGCIVHGNLVRRCALLYKNDAMLQILLEESHSVPNETFLVCLLSFLILSATEASQWRIGTVAMETSCHNMAMAIIKQIRDVDAVKHFLSKSESEITDIVGKENVGIFEQEIREDLTKLGLFGLALKHGKFSIARMLHLAGYDVTPMHSMMRETTYSTQFESDFGLMAWLAPALRDPLSLQLSCRNVLRRDPLYTRTPIPNTVPAAARELIQMRDLDRIEAHDSKVRVLREASMDSTYISREMSKAALQHMTWIYQ